LFENNLLKLYLDHVQTILGCEFKPLNACREVLSIQPSYVKTSYLGFVFIIADNEWCLVLTICRWFSLSVICWFYISFSWN